ncbi:hypothetical protein CMUS01_09404 [Colletotrichum musicola]|uniref:Uncharacterized protein n=1 Tax=Colletotrichum musicola TaxID=2175873 RepID=A0A8H6K8J8_9PEZI|nr:hypothetical protein CMUS01_09404 [Colletotrichum musicola]
MLADSAKISILGSLRDEGIYRPGQTVIQPETVARANTMLNSHHDYETIRNLLKHAVEEDALGLSPLSKADPNEALRLLQRFRSWAVPNLRFDRYVLKTDKGHPSLYGIGAYLRDAMVLLAMKQLWDNNQYLEWQPDIHPAAIRQAVAFAGEIGRTSTTELVRAFHTRLQIASCDPKDNFFPRSPCQRRRLVARFFCGPQKCKVFQGPGSPEPVGDVSAVDDKSTMRRVRFAEPQKDPRRDL